MIMSFTVHKHYDNDWSCSMNFKGDFNPNVALPVEYWKTVFKSNV